MFVWCANFLNSFLKKNFAARMRVGRRSISEKKPLKTQKCDPFPLGGKGGIILVREEYCFQGIGNGDYRGIIRGVQGGKERGK